MLHPNLDDALANGFAPLVGRAPHATRLWLTDAAGFTARWDTDGDGSPDASGAGPRTVRFSAPGVYEPSVTLSAPGRPDVTLRQRVVVLGDAPAGSEPGRHGVNEDLGWDPPSGIPSQIALMKEAGVEWVRLPVRWQWLEPQRGSYRWERYEGAIDQARDADLKLLAVLGGTPLWSSGIDRRTLPRSIEWDSFEPRETSDFAAYVYRVVDRFRGRIAAYELMNEPNSPVHWNPRPNAARFVELLCAGYLAAKYADPNAVTVVGGLNGNGLTLGWEAPESRDFLKAIYRGAGARCFDVMAIHPFAHPTENGIAVLQSWIDETRRYMAAQGDARELWLTETGWSSGRALWGHTTISEEQQAEWVRAIYRDVVGPQKIFWYNFKEDHANPTDPEAQWGWVRADLTPKPAFRAFSDLRRSAAMDGRPPPRS
ncbi:MAG TPA: beta-galactosidase [Candidatus Limnocylindria bacterium]|nr:beta-galactosidase [Candidatus Limnocylindria bacterium]